MRPILYTLDEHGTPKPVIERNRASVLRWGRSMEKEGRLVKQSCAHGVLVSTIFLGVDYAFHGPPLVWETMVFNEDREDLDCDRCAGGREQAEAMHEEMCAKHGVPP